MDKSQIFIPFDERYQQKTSGLASFGNVAIDNNPHMRSTRMTERHGKIRDRDAMNVSIGS
jgi:hypothetical protein